MYILAYVTFKGSKWLHSARGAAALPSEMDRFGSADLLMAYYIIIIIIIMMFISHKNADTI